MKKSLVTGNFKDFLALHTVFVPLAVVGKEHENNVKRETLRRIDVDPILDILSEIGLIHGTHFVFNRRHPFCSAWSCLCCATINIFSICAVL